MLGKQHERAKQLIGEYGDLNPYWPRQRTTAQILSFWEKAWDDDNDEIITMRHW